MQQHLYTHHERKCLASFVVILRKASFTKVVNNTNNSNKLSAYGTCHAIRNEDVNASAQVVSRHDGEGQRKLRSRGGGEGKGKRVIFDARPYVKVWCETLPEEGCSYGRMDA